MKAKTIIIIGACVVVAGVGTAVVLKANHKEIQYRTMPVVKGDLNISVTSSGTVNPLLTVQVGTQVSGTVAKLYADFNSRVRRGQIVALLDTTFLRAALDLQKAALDKATTAVRLAMQTMNRTKALLDKGLAAQADYDSNVADYETAVANKNSAEANLKQAQINLKYATIISPIDGIVISRNVDVGQTVAASLSAPTLFVIADDLKKMQLQVSVDEGDIGSVHIGEKSTFTVDAYPDKTFEGTVSQIRLNPTTTQNVVNYTVMVDVANPEMQLLPGMTANVTITSQSFPNVLKVPSSALKFTPPDFAQSMRNRGGSGRSDSSGRSRDTSFHRDTSSSGGHHWGGGTGGGGNASSGSGGAGRANGSNGMSAASGTTGPAGAGGWANGGGRRTGVFVLDSNKPRRVRLNVIATNGSETAVEGQLTEGQQVIVGVLSTGKNTPQTGTTPFGNAGGPRRF